MNRVTRQSEWYPTLFRGIPNEPTTLYYEGNPSLVHEPCIAIIGTREPTQAGYAIAYKLAAYYAENGYTIVGGLCPGIDTAAHQGTLSVGGHTIAVLASTLGHDINTVHKGNGSLAHRIVESGGLLITEYTQPAFAPRRYFERDRLQSGLSHIVIPVQSGCASVTTGKTPGTFHTVEHAHTQGRRVCCPYPPEDDVRTYPEKWAGITHLIGSGKVTPFHSNELDHIL